MAKKKEVSRIDHPHHPNYVEGGNAKSIYVVQELMSWDKPDLQDPKAVTDRLIKYFQFMATVDSKPLVSGLAQALGITRFALNEIANNVDGTSGMRKVNAQTQEIISDAYQSLETAFEFNFLNGKINPVTGIWISKNHFGYQDKKEMTIVHKDPLGNTVDKAELERRYLESVVTNK